MIEIHGHAANSTNYNIEISCGLEKRKKFSIRLAKMLQELWAENAVLSRLSISGDYDKIALKAHKTATVIDERWIPFHIELPSSLRIDESGSTGRPPQIGYDFCDYLAESVQNFVNL